MSWADEERYWRAEYGNRSYGRGRSYEELAPAYRFGYESSLRYGARGWNDVESDLSSDWTRYPHRSDSNWEQIKDAVRDAWDRMVARTFPSM